MQKKTTKGLNESNHLVRGGFLVAGVTCVVMVLLVVTMNFTFLRNPLIAKDWYLRIFLMALVIFFTALICRLFICYLANTLNSAYLKRFTEIKILGTFAQTLPKLYNPQPKLKHAVLLLHGFTGSPEQFNHLATQFQVEKIPFYAPNILGFGLNTTQLLQTVRYEDWLREALEHYDALHLLAEEISVIGHSMGGLLATFIAQHRPVKNLILSSPAYYAIDGDMKYKKILFTPVLGKIYSWVVPFLPKSLHDDRQTTYDTLDTSIAINVFQYLAVPVECIIEFFKLQEHVDIKQAHFGSLIILYGKHDVTINNAKTFAYLAQHQIKHQDFGFENSAHNIFEDYDRDQICKTVINILQN